MKYFIGFCFVCVFLCAVGALGSESYFQQTLPRRPDAKNGHVIPRNVHGADLYYTEGELWVARGFFSGGFFFGIIGGLLEVRQRRLGLA